MYIRKGKAVSLYQRFDVSIHIVCTYVRQYNIYISIYRHNQWKFVHLDIEITDEPNKPGCC